jgi:hypothetical protein
MVQMIIGFVYSGWIKKVLQSCLTINFAAKKKIYIDKGGTLYITHLYKKSYNFF